MAAESKSDNSDAKHEEKEQNDVFSRANKIIESDRSKLVFFDFIPRESMTKFINSADFENKNILIERSKWLNHANFEHQSLLVKAHRNFRQSSQKLVKHSLNANLAIRAFKNSYENDTTTDFNFDKINDHESKNKNTKNDSNDSISSKNKETQKTDSNNDNDNDSDLNLMTSDESFSDRIHELIRDMQRLYDSMHWSLRSHSNYEETKLFQFLKIKYKCSNLIELLLQDHLKIEKLESAMEMILRKYDGFSQRMSRHYQNEAQNLKNIQRMDILSMDVLKLVLDFDDVLIRHLGEEETVVVPMLLQLSKKEYDTYYNARSYKEALAYNGSNIGNMMNDKNKNKSDNKSNDNSKDLNNVSKLKIDNSLPK